MRASNQAGRNRRPEASHRFANTADRPSCSADGGRARGDSLPGGGSVSGGGGVGGTGSVSENGDTTQPGSGKEKAVPRVSICCATYNHRPYIQACLDGFLAQQTDFAFEILVHDDASTDGTTEIVKAYAARYPELIRVVRPEENQYSKGIRTIVTRFLLPLARGEYIALCEGDDYWTDPRKLARQVAVMDGNPAVSLCFHAADILHPNGKTRGRYAPYRSSRAAAMEDIIRRRIHFCPTASLLLRKAYWLEYPAFFRHCHVGDYPLMLYFATRGEIYYLHETMAVYRKKHPGCWSLAYVQGHPDVQLRQMQTEVDMLEAFDRYTKYAYHAALVKKQWRLQLCAWRRLKLYDRLTAPRYRPYLRYLPLPKRIPIYFRAYMNPRYLKGLFYRIIRKR